jgi:hypothetical protein
MKTINLILAIIYAYVSLSVFVNQKTDYDTILFLACAGITLVFFLSYRKIKELETKTK